MYEFRQKFWLDAKEWTFYQWVLGANRIGGGDGGMVRVERDDGALAGDHCGDALA